MVYGEGYDRRGKDRGGMSAEGPGFRVEEWGFGKGWMEVVG